MVFEVFFWNLLIPWLVLMWLSYLCLSSSSCAPRCLCRLLLLRGSPQPAVPHSGNRKCPILHITPFRSYQLPAFAVTGQQLGLHQGIYWGNCSSVVPPHSLSLRSREWVAQPGHPLARFCTLGRHLMGVRYDGEVFETKTNHKKSPNKKQNNILPHHKKAKQTIEAHDMHITSWIINVQNLVLPKIKYI